MATMAQTTSSHKEYNKDEKKNNFNVTFDISNCRCSFNQLKKLPTEIKPIYICVYSRSEYDWIRFPRMIEEGGESTQAAFSHPPAAYMYDMGYAVSRWVHKRKRAKWKFKHTVTPTKSSLWIFNKAFMSFDNLHHVCLKRKEEKYKAKHTSVGMKQTKKKMNKRTTIKI